MEKTYNIAGMTCSSCAASVERILNRDEKIEKAQVNLVLNQVTITSSKDIDLVKQKAALSKGGYELSEIATLRNIVLDITGMTCSSCSSALERVLKQIPGITQSSVNLVMNSATIEYDPALVKLTQIQEKIKKAGYEGTLQVKKQTVEKKEHFYRIYATLFISIILLYIGMSHMLGDIQLPLPDIIHYTSNPLNFALIQFILASLILWSGHTFFTHGIKALFHKVPNMDTLVAIGTGSAYVYSLFSLIQLFQGDMHAIHRLYFESAGVVVALVMFGKHLEAVSKKKTTGAIQSLLSLRPEQTILWKDGVEHIIAIDEVTKQDILVVKAGDTIPLDGIIIEGFSSVNESMLTGESMPIDKQVGGKVIGGTINLNGRLLMEVTALAEETTLSKIIKMVEEAQGKKAPIARVADKISLVFVPVVMSIAFISALIWFFVTKDVSFALTIFVSVLVIACPCALGLATPTAIMVGSGKAAQMGIFIKSGEALEETCHIDAIVFDKTGTLTNGKPVVTDIVTTLEEADFMHAATAVEQGSKHPLANAIIEKTKTMGIAIEPAQNILTLNGKGMQADYQDKKIFVGNRSLLQENGIKTTAFEAQETALLKQGKTVMWVAIERIAVGIIAVADEIKQEAAEVVAQLQKQGVEVYMITGDNEITAKAIADKAGIRNVIAQVLPEEKGSKVEAIQATGKRVAMVGDGINDAIALSKAQVGIAIGSGSDVAVESADIVLVKDNLKDVLQAIRLSRGVIRNIKQNLFWAFFYNVLGIPIAAGVLYIFGGPLLSPVFAGAAMAFSSVSVVANALRLKNFK